MADSSFVSADVEKIDIFERKSQEAIKEFDDIKTKFNETNENLLKVWLGKGADAYQKETSHILENIGGIKDILDTINNGAVKNIKDNYMKLDQELCEFNKNPNSK